MFWVSLSVIVLGAAVVTVVLGVALGVEAFVVGLVASVVPVPVLVLAFLWLGRYEPGPTAYLAFCFLWGAVVATAVALGVNSGAAWLFDRLGWFEGLVAVVVAPVIEELGKAAAPLLLWWRRRAVTGITRGIVYCGLSATGFAMVENVLYLGGYGYRTGLEEYGRATGLQLVFAIFIVRILMAGFAHPLFTAASGVGIGAASRTPRLAVRWLAVTGGLVAAMVLHATWNLMSVLVAETGEQLFLLYGYVAVMLPILVGMVGLAIWLRSWEGQLTQRVLPEYVRAGWLSPPEVAALRSLGTRHSARRWAQRVAGEAGRQAMRRFQVAATRLALHRDEVRRGLGVSPQRAERMAAEEQALLNTLVESRAVFAGRDPLVPPAWWDGTAYRITFPDGETRTVPAPPEPVMPVPVPMAPPPPSPTWAAPAS
ncbi:MAG: PrsW family intramembrane metalloprotease [Micromonosporaceae bacterium]|jgi:RsiW-degrading membrane proteinase PrsW (M82 family)